MSTAVLPDSATGGSSDGHASSSSPVVAQRDATAGPVGPSPDTLVRVRLRFSKVGKVRWTSHRDVARMWERALRRSGLPVAYSGGFSPHPLLSFGLALPTGCESTAEYVDVALDPSRVAGVAAAGPDAADGVSGCAASRSVDRRAAPWWVSAEGDVAQWAGWVADQCPDRLSDLFPVGVDVDAAVALERGAPSLQQAVSSCTWRIAVASSDLDAVRRQVALAMASASLPVSRERKGRRQVEDLRPSLLAVEVGGAGSTGAVVLQAETVTRPRGVRPAEIADALGLELGLARRTHQWIERDGSHWEPVVTGPARVAMPEASAL